MIKHTPILYLARLVWSNAGTHRWLIAVYVLLFALAQCLSLTEPYLIGLLLNALQTNSAPSLHDVYVFVLAYLGLQIGFLAFHAPARIIERRVAFHVRGAYRSRLFHYGTQLSLKWHRDHHSGESIDRINRAATALHDFASNSFMVLSMLLRLCGAQLILFCYLPVASLAASIASFLVCCLIFFFDRLLYDRHRRLNACENRIASAIHDYFSNMLTVITLRLEPRVVAEVRRRIGLSLPFFERTNTLCEVKWLITSLLITALVVGVLCCYAAQEMAAGRALLGGTLFTLFEYLRRIGESFYNFAALHGTLVRQAADARGAENLEEAFQSRGARAVPETLPRDWRLAEVEGLTFRYADGKSRTHLDHVSIRLEQGRAIALVGPSGCGKSTLLSLLRGLEVPITGRLFCDGQPMAEGLGCLSGVTTLIPQNPDIFSDTLRFNITFGMEASEDDVNRALQVARFEPVVARLPDGLATNIAENGVNLSGGERQRLALARGVFFSRDSQIILLDEPTSGVDAANERLIYEGLLQLYRDRCVVSSLHRLHLLPLFDEVYVIVDGRMVERGTCAALLASGGILARMWAAAEARARTVALLEQRQYEAAERRLGFPDRRVGASTGRRTVRTLGAMVIEDTRVRRL